MTKRPWIAAVLNLFFYGLGYVYLGKRTIFGLGLLVGNVAFYSAFALALISPLPASAGLYMNINSVGFGIISIVFAYDAYQLARETR